ncbi:hypothetical protein SAMN05216412_10586 [Nitrosospira multiformis]|uniref:Uncharacterized protein n=2 Tax=Nitrosospira multiformis TaxID=1231 RepID=A0A1I0DP77_9PROT|nr:hypothetical protein SAMN05216412_10586 [Nitrosospira multiformis]
MPLQAFVAAFLEQSALLAPPTAPSVDTNHIKSRMIFVERYSLPILIFYWLLGIAYGRAGCPIEHRRKPAHESMGGGIRMIDKGTDGTAAVHYYQREPGSNPVWKTGCSTVGTHIAFLREGVARLYYGLSEIVDGKFVKPSKVGRFEFTPILVAHALGAALLDYLDNNSSLTILLRSN